MERTYNGVLRIKDLGKKVNLKGWVSKKRDLGGLVFIDLRDRYGITQVIVDPSNPNYEVAISLKNEYVIDVVGVVSERQSKNPNLPTGDIEVIAEEIKLINTSLQPPIIIADKTDALEDTRLKYRYLDLRRPIMQNYLIQKSKITAAFREFLSNNDFLELETPILAKSTPEGARDYLVPSRLYEGEFYALPQSPQIFKQLYMIAGFDKYFQIARCFRDEDLRSDRQPEFTQIDIETSFLNQDQILEIVEKMFNYVFKKIKGIDLEPKFERYTYDEVMDMYGSDKPDLRFDMKLIDCKDLFSHIEFLNNEVTKCIIVNNSKQYTRKSIDKFTDLVKKYKAKGLAYLRLQNNELSGSIAKFLDDNQKNTIISKLNLKEDDLVLIVSDKKYVTQVSLGALRSFFGSDQSLYEKKYSFLWVTDWPVFEYDEENKKYVPSTHPFTAPKDECIKYMDTEPEKVYANAYDLVLNGYELGSGSLRIYNQDLQQKLFEACELSEDEIKQRFGFFVDALKYGTPPHGGIGLGLERITMIMTDTDNIKDVVAFPKTQSARDLMMDAPSSVDEKQLTDVHIKINK